MLADIRSRMLHVSHDRIVRLSTFDRTSQGMMNLLGFIMSLVYMQAVHGWLSAYERLVNSQNFFSPYLTQEDMSRIGRNYLETGFYTEVVFRKHNVRFIAIANGVDNDQPETDEFVPFLNIMNEWYLKDQSKKITAAYQLRGKSGLPTNNNCLYGYRKDPNVKHHWLVDEEAAAIVRRIYQMACEGHGPYKIARILTKEKVDSPGYYFTKHA